MKIEQRGEGWGHEPLALTAPESGMSGKERTQRWRARLDAGGRVYTAEADEEATEQLYEAPRAPIGLQWRAQADDRAWHRIGRLKDELLRGPKWRCKLPPRL